MMFLLKMLIFGFHQQPVCRPTCPTQLHAPRDFSYVLIMDISSFIYTYTICITRGRCVSVHSQTVCARIFSYIEVPFYAMEEQFSAQEFSETTESNNLYMDPTTDAELVKLSRRNGDSGCSGRDCNLTIQHTTQNK